MTQTNRTFTPVQLFTGIIFNKDVSIDVLTQELEDTFNHKITMISDLYPFNHSSYYTNEMGLDLQRYFVCFNELVAPETAYKYKSLSINLEERHKKNNKRIFNLDPGIISLHNLILYSTKNFAHRIACNQGIYAEVTLLFQKNAINVLDWTYPDFQQQAIQQYFLNVRSTYHSKLRSLNHVK